MSVQYYRLCPLGHRVICPHRLVRPTCRICGQQVDNMSPLLQMDEEIEKTVQMQQEQATTSEQDKKASVQAVQMSDSDPIEGGRRRRQVIQNVQPDTKPLTDEIRHRRTAEMSELEPTSMTEGRRRRTAGSEKQILEAPPGDTSMQDAPASGVRLELFGMSIPIPAEGGFFGRDGIGAQQLEGYLLVSRQHVFLKPDRGGRLMVEDRGSTNGTWYTHDSNRQRLEQGRTVILESEDVLWLYNIPLKVVSEYV